MSKSNKTKPVVTINVASDEHAAQITSVLEALGYEVVRDLDQGQAPSRLEWAIEQVSRRHGLTSRESEVLEGVLAGETNTEIAKRLQISQATAKWHLHNVFGKTKTGNRESLLRLALQLAGVRRGAVDDADED